MRGLLAPVPVAVPVSAPVLLLPPDVLYRTSSLTSMLRSNWCRRCLAMPVTSTRCPIYCFRFFSDTAPCVRNVSKLLARFEPGLS